jgi:hypothetical protein
MSGAIPILPHYALWRGQAQTLLLSNKTVLLERKIKKRPLLPKHFI